jgi:salicylate hydroxylase
MTTADVIVIGAGIGGLTTAVALAQQGRRVRVYERAPALRPVGAGVTLESGAMRSLEMLGLDERVRAVGSDVGAYPFRHFSSGEILRSGFDGRERPAEARAACQLHRADLQQVLLTELENLGVSAPRLGCELVSIDVEARRVLARFGDGATDSAQLLVAADGIHSTCRSVIAGPLPSQFMGQVAYRCLVPLSSGVGDDASAFIGPRRVFNRYPLRARGVLNCVGIVRSTAWQDDGWKTPAAREEFEREFAGWHPSVLGAIAAAPSDGLLKWALVARPPIARWSLGGAVLLGDAAHPILPFLGNGAALAIEDAVVLARALSSYDRTERALQRFEEVRRPRAAAMYERSLAQAALIQGADPNAFRSAPAPASDPATYDYDPAALVV